MKLTQQQKEDVTRLSGWPSVSQSEGDPSYNSYLNQWVLDRDYSDSVVTEIQTYIDRIKGIDLALTNCLKRLRASSIGHNEIVLNSEEIYQLRQERNRVVDEFMSYLRIPEYDPD